ncbi:ComEC/Rec2-related protein [Granulicatella balaenopterae]|uniref:ComEC/Rec2-related protein n=1 Tax=Granulicatella balaenopterae TaxID=137733 RepID=A0A1H9KLX4_9LACT|nr:ComEC/Rec2 family competence protein [Granulicatella balaenopterae]SER00069.1 ComEC/Rec2-related protein [Granulicatella balaenopterae]
MKEKWPYIALVLIFFASFYQEMKIIKGLIIAVIIIRIFWEHNRLLWVLTLGFGISLVLHLMYLDSYRQQLLPLAGQEQPAMIQMDVNDLMINGDLLTGYATVETKEQRFKTKIYYKIPSKKEKEWISQFQQDMKMVATVSFEEVEGCRNLKTFDYAKYLKSRKIFLSTKINQIKEIEPIKGMKSRLHYWRYQLVDKVRKNHNGAITEYALALIFGEKQELSLDDLAMFKELGIMHLLAISGLHIMILVSLLEGVMWRSGLTREASQWGLFVLLVGYGCLIRWNISGTRAIGIVLLQILCLKLWQKDLSTMDALSVMAIVNCIVNPYIINSSAFQLSYGMCFFVILVGRLEVRFINDKEASGGYDDSLVTRLVHMGILCLLAIPLIARYFYSYHLLSALIGAIVTFILAKWLVPCLVGYIFLVVVDSQMVLAVLVGLFNGSISLLLAFFRSY